MSDENALLAAIWEYPHEDTPRLMYADWLDEHGGESNAARAEFIRVQCELKRNEWGTPRYQELHARASKILLQHSGEWKTGFSVSIRNASYERGFFRPQSRTYTATKFLALKPGALDEAPAWEIELKSYVTGFRRVVASPNFARVGWLGLKDRCPGSCFNLLAEAPNARHVGRLTARLDTRHNWTPTTDDVPGLASLTDFRLTAVLPSWKVRELADSPLAPTISSLHLSHSRRLGAEGVAALARGDRFPRLAELQLVSCELGAADFAPPPDPPAEGRVATLILASNPLGDAGLAALLAHPFASQVTLLNLSGTQLTDAGAVALAEWPGASRLRRLSLGGNAIGRAGIAAITRSARFANLEQLDLNDNPLNRDEESILMLKDRFGGKIRLTLSRTTATQALSAAGWCWLWD